MTAMRKMAMFEFNKWFRTIGTIFQNVKIDLLMRVLSTHLNVIISCIAEGIMNLFTTIIFVFQMELLYGVLYY